MALSAAQRVGDSCPIGAGEGSSDNAVSTRQRCLALACSRQCGPAQLSPEQKCDLDTLLAAQPSPARTRYELLPAIQEQTVPNPDDVKKLMTIMHEARTNVFPRGHQNLRNSRQPYDIVLRLIAGIEEAPAPALGTRLAYLDLTDSRRYRQSLYKLLQVLRESEASGDYGNAKLFVPFLQILATDLLNVETSDDGDSEPR